MNWLGQYVQAWGATGRTSELLVSTWSYLTSHLYKCRERDFRMKERSKKFPAQGLFALVVSLLGVPHASPDTGVEVWSRMELEPDGARHVRVCLVCFCLAEWLRN